MGTSTTESYRGGAGSSPLGADHLLQQLKGLASASKSPRTYAGLAASKVPGGQPRQDRKAAKPGGGASAFFNRNTPSPDLLAKVASLMKQTSGGSARGSLAGSEKLRPSPPDSERSTPEAMFAAVAAAQQQRRPAADGAQRPGSVTPARQGSMLWGAGSRRSSTTPEPAQGTFGLPLAGQCGPSSAAPSSAAASRRQTTDGEQPSLAPDTTPAWSEELLNWMLAEKAELLLEVQRAQRRQQELQHELDRARARAGSELEDEVQRLKVERRMLLERLQRLAQQDADSAALLERIQMENDALTTELERSQEVCKEMLAARRAARDALSEMSAQNARLVSAYVEKKQEAAQLKEEMRQQQREAELRIRTLEAELQAAQAQCVELHGRLQHSGHLPTSPGVLSPPYSAGAAASGLPGPSTAWATGSPLGGAASTSGVEFASPFSTPVHHRTPPSAQPQHGKENASWSGNRAGVGGGTASTARRKLAPGHSHMTQGDGPAAALQAGPEPQPAKGGEWDKERSELLSLLERLQSQLSAHAEQQQGTPARQPEPPSPPSQQPTRQQRYQPAQGEQPASPYNPAGASPCMAASPEPATSARTTPSPPLDEAGEPSPPPAAAMTPGSHRSAPSTGPTPRHSHFSVPRYSHSEPPSRAEQYGVVGGSSRQSAQAAAPHSRRASGINLSQAFEGASRAAPSSSLGSRGSGGSGASASRASTRSDESESGTYRGPHAPRPASASAAYIHLSSPSSASEASTPRDGPASPLAPLHSSHLKSSPVIPPTATPFASHPPEDASTPAPHSGAQQLCQQPEDGVVAATPGGEQAVEDDQRLADAEKRNAALEAELQRLRQLQQESDERMKEEELRRRVDQHKQAGNAAFQQQRYEQAVQEYTAGLELTGPASATPAAVLHCNRAAALHAMGRYLDAVADCFRAEQRDPSYARLYHRRADAYCAVGAYDAAAQDLARLVQMGCGREVSARLSEIQHKLRAQHPVNHYAVLGVKSSATPAEVKAAYRSLALKFHPDKAGQALPAPAADAIFKLVTAANAALSDAERRRAHDLLCLRHKYKRFYSYQF